MLGNRRRRPRATFSDMKKPLLAAIAALLALAPTAVATPSVADAATGAVSVVGTGYVDLTDPPTTFEFQVHAHGDGRTGRGVLWLTHSNDDLISWAVARVDCVRRHGRAVVVTGRVDDAQDFAVGPGDPISVSVRDGDPDLIGFGSGNQVRPCLGPPPNQAVSRGDFTVDR